MGNLRKEIPDNIFEEVLKDCIDKVDGVNDLDWEDIVEKYNLTCHRDVLRKGVASPLSAYTVYNFMKKKMESNVDSNAILKEIEEKKLELEKERIKLQDQRREYKKYLRQDARFEYLKETMVDKIKNDINITNPLNINQVDINTSDREAVLILSDWHIGSTSNNHWNKFNLSIAKERVEKLLKKTVQYCLTHKVSTIHIELLGDLTNGYLHLGNRVENEEDVISQVMTVSEMLSQFINSLSSYVDKVKVYSSTGNHGRCSANLKESLELENFERLIPWYLEARLNNPKVEFIPNEIDNNLIVIRFLNEVIYGVHGHLDKPNVMIDNWCKMLKEFPTEAHLGHFHSYKEFDEYDMTTTVNGTLSGVDEFAKKIRKTSKPMQTLMIYSEEGRECTYKIKL